MEEKARAEAGLKLTPQAELEQSGVWRLASLCALDPPASPPTRSGLAGRCQRRLRSLGLSLQPAQPVPPRPSRSDSVSRDGGCGRCGHTTIPASARAEGHALVPLGVGPLGRSWRGRTAGARP